MWPRAAESPAPGASSRGGRTSATIQHCSPQGAKGMRIAVVTEGFGHPQSLPAVDQLVRNGAEQFGKLGAEVAEVSIPMHRLGHAIWLPIAAEGATVQM